MEAWTKGSVIGDGFADMSGNELAIVGRQLHSPPVRTKGSVKAGLDQDTSAIQADVAVNPPSPERWEPPART